MKEPSLRVLSLGAGVQSTALALLAADGTLPRPDFAIFADTGWEPSGVYEHVERIKAHVPFPVITVRNGNIREDMWARVRGETRRLPSVPLHLVMPDGRRALQRRQCTDHYKMTPIRREMRQRLPKGGVAELWLGITTDEAARMKPSGVRYIMNRWPLIELGWSRAMCERYLRQRGWVVAKSACVCCPYRSAAAWRQLRDTAPLDWQAAVLLDDAIRRPTRGIRGEQYLHFRCKPLQQAVEDTHPSDQRSLFIEECEGLCGV